jgi:CheY-like chemotaxis protein
MNAVLGFTQLLAEDPLEPPSLRQRERLACIRGAGEHLLLLIDDVLDLSRLEADQRPLALEPVPLAAIGSETAQWLHDMARRQDVHLDWHPEALPGVVLGERRALGQIALNLVGNAIKYNRPGGWVRLASESEVVAGQPCWRLSVRDSGRGLSPDQIERLFQPFERLGVEREGIEGTGLGLSIVRQLVERLGGRIAVRSEPGEGSEFTVWLPAAALPAASSAPPSAAPPGAAVPAGEARLKLLCIEDNPVNMLLVREMLAMRPAVTLRGAELGLEGLTLARDWHPDVVLLDLQLPDLHGSEVLRLLRADPELAGLHVIALSANAMPEDVQAALAAGFDAYWTKPLDLQLFLQRIDQLLERQARLARGPASRAVRS